MAFDEKLLQRSWTHSREEDTPGQKVFRPDDHAFPPSRGPRHGYQFLAGGRLVKRAPGPDDRRTSTEGTWSLDPQQGRLTLRVPGAPDEVLQLQAVEPGRLVITM